MPHLKEISKCRRIPKEKQSLGSEDSIDDEDTELDDDFVKMRKLFRESQDQKFIRRLKKKLKQNLLKQKEEGSLESSSDPEHPQVKYPDPLPKTDKNKKSAANGLNFIKKSDLYGQVKAKNKPQIKPLKKTEDLGKTATDGGNIKSSVLSNPKSDKLSKNDKTAKYDKAESNTKKNNNTKKGHKESANNIPFTDNDRDLAKGEVEAMIRMVLKQSREEGGDGEEINDVSLGETESTPSDEELDLGKEPEMSSTPDDVSGETLSEEEDKNRFY